MILLSQLSNLAFKLPIVPAFGGATLNRHISNRGINYCSKFRTGKERKSRQNNNVGVVQLTSMASIFP